MMIVDLLLPRTDAGVAVQWAIMVPVWIVSIIATRRWPRDFRHFVYGLIMMNLAWFAIRAVH